MAGCKLSLQAAAHSSILSRRSCACCGPSFHHPFVAIHEPCRQTSFCMHPKMRHLPLRSPVLAMNAEDHPRSCMHHSEFTQHVACMVQSYGSKLAELEVRQQALQQARPRPEPEAPAAGPSTSAPAPGSTEQPSSAPGAGPASPQPSTAPASSGPPGPEAPTAGKLLASVTDLPGDGAGAVPAACCQ